MKIHKQKTFLKHDCNNIKNSLPQKAILLPQRAIDFVL